MKIILRKIYFCLRRVPQRRRHMARQKKIMPPKTKLTRVFVSRALLYFFVSAAFMLVAKRLPIGIYYVHWLRFLLLLILSVFAGAVFAVVSVRKRRRPVFQKKSEHCLLVFSAAAVFIPEMLDFVFGRVVIGAVPIGKVFTADTWFYLAAATMVLASFLLVEFVDLFPPKIKIPRCAPWIIFAFGAVIYSILSVERHQIFDSSTMDLAGYDQAVYLLSRFKTPASSVYLIPNLLGDHFEPILILLAPLFWIINDVRALLVAQAAIVSLAVFPIYGLAKKYLKSNFAAAAICLSYLFFIGVQDAVEFDFHPLTLIPAALAYLFYFFDEKKYGRYFAALFITLLVKETAAIYAVFFGFYALWRKKFLVGAITIAAGILWYILAVKIIIPHLSGNDYGHIGAYHALGAGPVEILGTIITRPWHVLGIMFEPIQKTISTLSLFGSFAFLPLAALAELILVLPMIGEKYLTTDRAANWEMWWHYSISIAPFLSIAAILGIKRLAEKFSQYERTVVYGLSLAVLLSTLAVAFVYYRYPPFTAPLAKVFTRKFYHRYDDHIRELNRVLSEIPTHASVTAQNGVAPHLSHREKIYRLNPDMGEVIRADYLVMDFAVNMWPYSEEEFTEIRDKLKDDEQYELKIDEYPLYVFVRITPAKPEEIEPKRKI